MVNFSKGKGYSKKDIVESGTPFMRYGNLYTDFEIEITDIKETVEEKPKSVKSKGGEILVPSSGETPSEIARASTLLKKDVIIGGDINILTVKNNNVLPTFLALDLNTNRNSKELSKYAVGNSVVHIYNKDLHRLKIYLPDIETQKKIIRIWRTLDKLLTLHKRKLKIIDETIHELREQLFSTKYIAGKKVKSEKMKLNDFLEEVIEHSNKENQYPLLSSTNNGIETRSGRVSGSSNIGYKILRKNQLVLSPQNLWLGNININRDFEVGIVSPSYKVFDIKNIKIIYLENILKTERMKYNFDKISIQGASVVRRNLDMKEFLNLEVRVTQKNEQEKLVKTFVQLRNIKFSLRSKIKILEKLKILYLDKMFI
ncbi:restriction endonuclease subunit S [Nosocomiicoccus ampullae]|nr:restriction endonuclease subunit S [Nosocomiicoccus ampullae]